MKIKIEVSRPHYHPSHESVKELTLTKKRDLSVPPHWVANERVNHPETNIPYAVVMPPRNEELWEERQAMHIHCDSEMFRLLGSLSNKMVYIKNKPYSATVKESKDVTFEPTIHIDHIFSEQYNINSNDEAEVQTV
jgi:hypothetical protein